MAPIDPSADPAKEVLNHGMALDPESRRVQCNYCGKVVPGFNRLQHHLGGIRGNIVECPDVLVEVKEYFRNTLLAVKVSRLVKEVGDLDQAGPSSKRRCSSDGKGNGVKPVEFRTGQTSHSTGQTQTRQSNDQTPRVGTEVASTSRDQSLVLRACSGNVGRNSPAIEGKRCIGRFFFENGIDFDAVTSQSFRSMVGNFLKSDMSTDSIPSIAELKGWIFEEELNDMIDYVKNIRLSWSRTGCSILLDGWTDQSERSLISAIVECPQGAVYLRTADVSPSKGADALQLFIESILQEVGIQNVIQIVSHSSSDSMEAVSKQLIEKYRSLFWTVSATHCLSLILGKIARINSIRQTLEKAKTITQYIYSRSEVLRLLRRHIGSHDLVRQSKIREATSFLTLENFLVEQSNLERMFTSSEWWDSPSVSSDEGIKAALLIGDSSFWDGVVTAVKASIPLVRAMSLINGDGQPHMGFIYETMDQIKETISEEFEGMEPEYTQYWAMIDEIWNTILHSPLHAAGYFLNPRLHFTEDFYSDTEVAGGLLITIVRMVDDQRTQDLISDQVSLYGKRHADFLTGIDSKDSMSPAIWWSLYGGHCPELQNVAVRILSQTCNGAESYGLKRDIAEKLLSNTERNVMEEQRLVKLTYLHYNLKLKQAKLGAKFDILADELDPTNDWITDSLFHAEVPRSESEPLVRMNAHDSVSAPPRRSTFEIGGPSRVPPKAEP